jgi:hypothetical protein
VVGLGGLLLLELALHWKTVGGLDEQRHGLDDVEFLRHVYCCLVCELRDCEEGFHQINTTKYRD